MLNKILIVTERAYCSNEARNAKLGELYERAPYKCMTSRPHGLDEPTRVRLEKMLEHSLNNTRLHVVNLLPSSVCGEWSKVDQQCAHRYAQDLKKRWRREYSGLVLLGTNVRDAYWISTTAKHVQLCTVYEDVLVLPHPSPSNRWMGRIERWEAMQTTKRLYFSQKGL